MQETSDEIAFTQEYIDEITTHRYRVVRLWEENSTLFLNNPALLPLAPLTQTDSPATLLSQVGNRIARISDIDVRQNIAGCTEILAGLKFDKTLIRQFLREDVMKESVIYQDILEQGNKQGEQRLIIRMLNRRFREINPLLIERVRGLSIEQLETLGEALLDFSEVAELEAWLNQQQV